MASTPMPTTSLNAVKLWSMDTWTQAIQKTVFGHMFNRGSIYYAKDFLGSKNRGDELTFNYRGKLVGVPIGEGGTAVSNAEALDIKSHKMAVNVTRIPVQSPTDDTVEQQRTHVDFDDETRMAITDRVAELLDTSVFQQAAGVDPVSVTIDGTTYVSAADKLQIQGHNAIVAPTSERIIRPNSVANDQSLGASDKFTASLLDFIIEKNMRSIQPVKMLPMETMDCFMSPEQYVDLCHDAGSAVQQFTIDIARITGGQSNAIDNPYKNGILCAGKYKNIYLYVSSRVANGVNGSNVILPNVRRAIVVGRDALSFASPWGGRPSDKNVPFKFMSEMVDVEYYKVTEGRMLYGVKKMTPADKQDTGAFVISTYAAPHA